MKTVNLGAWILGLSMLTVTSCSSDDSNFQKGGSTDLEMSAVVNAYVDNVALPTYLDLKEKASSLNEKVIAFAENKTQENLDAACDAWRAAREPWEMSEAFLYGPADYAGLDPSIDSWPLDQNGLDQILQKGDFDDTKGESDEAISLRGFHTAEYLLFLNGKNRTVAEFADLNPNKTNDNATTYLKLVCSRIKSDADKLYQAWHDGLGTDEVPGAFGEEFKKHNTARFSSAATVISTIVDGCMDIAGEVGESKIGEPHTFFTSGQEDKGLYAVESWYSWNSLTDYTNNIKSIENSYFGGIGENYLNGVAGNRDAKNSLSALVASKDEKLDIEIRGKIDAAINAINAIPAPFRNNLGHQNVQKAMDACSELETSLLKIKTALGID